MLEIFNYYQAIMRPALLLSYYFVSAGTLLFAYSAASTGTKELPVELTEGSKKSSDSG